MSKILCALLVLAVLMTALVFVVSADEVNEVEYKKPDGTVDTTVTTFVAAVAAVNNNGGTITLKKDVTLTGNVSLQVNRTCTIDLGKYTLDLSGATLSTHLLIPGTNHSITIKGTGELKVGTHQKNLAYTGNLGTGVVSFIGEKNDHLAVTVVGTANAFDHWQGTIAMEYVDFKIAGYNDWAMNSKGSAVFTMKNCNFIVDVDEPTGKNGNGVFQITENSKLSFIDSKINYVDSHAKSGNVLGLFYLTNSGILELTNTDLVSTFSEMVINANNTSTVKLNGSTFTKNVLGHVILLQSGSSLEAVNSTFTSSTNNGLFNTQTTGVLRLTGCTVNYTGDNSVFYYYDKGNVYVTDSVINGRAVSAATGSAAKSLNFDGCSFNYSGTSSLFNLANPVKVNFADSTVVHSGTGEVFALKSGVVLNLERSTVSKPNKGTIFNVPGGNTPTVNAYACDISVVQTASSGSVNIVGGGGYVDASGETAKAVPATFSFEKCAITCFTIGYKGATAFSYGKYCLDLDFVDCSLSTSWRMFVGLRPTEGAYTKGADGKYTDIVGNGKYSTVDLVRCTSNSYKLNVDVTLKEGDSNTYATQTAKVDGKDTTFYKYTAVRISDNKSITLYTKVKNPNVSTDAFYTTAGTESTKIVNSDYKSFVRQYTVGNDHQFIRGNATTNITDCKISVEGSSGWADSATATLRFHGTNYTDFSVLSDFRPGLTQYDCGTAGEYQFVVTDKATNPVYTGGDYYRHYLLDSNTSFTNVGTDTKTAVGYYVNGLNGWGAVYRQGQYLIGDTFGSNLYSVFSTAGYNKLTTDSYLDHSVGGKTFEELAYTVVEFDFSTDTEHIDNYRFYLNTRTDSGSSDGNNGIAIKLQADGRYALTDNAGNLYYLPNAGTWTHVTYVFSTNKVEGKYVNQILVYVDGNLAFNLTDVSPKATKTGGFRFHAPTGTTVAEDGTFCLDNLTIRSYLKTTTFTEDKATLDSLFTNTPKALPAANVFAYATGYEYPMGAVNAFVPVEGENNDRFYSSVEDAIASLGASETLELINSLKGVYEINKAVTVDTNGNSFRTHSTNFYRSTDGNVYTYLPYTGAADQKFDFTFKNEDGTKTLANVTVILGNEFDLDTVAKLDSYLSGRDVYAHTEWSTTVGGTQPYADIITATTAGTVDLYAVIERVLQNAKFYGVVENGYDIYGASWNDFKNKVTTVTNDTLTLTILDNIDGVGSATFGTGATVYLDLNGKTINNAKDSGNKTNLFELVDRNTFYLYSSVEGGKAFALKAIVDITNSGYTNVTVNLGSFEGNDYGKNLYTGSSCLVDSNTNNSFVLNINGGTYARSVSDYSGFICDRKATLTANINNAVLVNNANASAFFNFSGKADGKAPKVTVTNSVFYSTNGVDLHNTSSNNPCVASYENCDFLNVKGNAMSNGTYSFKLCDATGKQMDKTTGNPVKMWDEATSTTLYFNNVGSFDVTAHKIDGVIIYKTVANNYVDPNLSGNLVNLTLQSDFVVNVYVPVDTPAAKVTLKHGDAPVDLAKQATVEIDGKSYYHFTYALNANAATEYVRLYLVDESGYVKLMKISIADYAKKILDGAYETEEKQLMMALLRYASEAETLLDGEANTTLTGILTTEKYQEFVTDYTDYGTALDVSSLAAAVSSARLNLDSQPDFVFTLVKEFAGTVTLTYRNFGGEEITKTYVVEAGEEASNISLNTMKIHELWKTITVTVEGTVGETAVSLNGTYNLGTYVQGVAEAENGYALAKAIFAYSKMAAAYREFVVANGGL